MGSGDLEGVVQCGRELREWELGDIVRTVEMFPGLSRWELAQTLCEHLGWVSATGSYKVEACKKLLEKLEGRGLVKLPAKRSMGKAKQQRVVWTDRTAPQWEVVGTVGYLGEVGLEVVLSREGKGLWEEYVGRYHYLGAKRPFGCFMRYFIVCKRGLVGCILMAGAAKSIGVRDRWIGWSEGQRLRNLGWVINNIRFLIFPWVRVKNLASHVLGQLGCRVCGDWYERWGYRPVLMETFVDPRHFDGGCYKAANWQYLGMTTGEGLVRPGKSYRTSPRKIFVRPLARGFRRLLCSDELAGEVHR